MKVSLMPHQLKGVKWMVEKENKPELGRQPKFKKKKDEQYGQPELTATVGGGILADDMGLGKTIQSIAVMLHNRPDPDEQAKVIFTLLD
jgi:SNF2 family DNA or RNA helicase